MQYEVRPINEEEFERFSRSLARAFLGDFRPEFLEFRAQIFERERSLGAFDGDEIVGTTGIFSYEMAVPGGKLGTAGVTMVSVAATHRRQGIVTAMMRRQLEDVRAKGEPMAALWASESLIYGRFGYGLAAQSIDWSIERARAKVEFAVPARGRTRFIDTDEARETWPALWDQVQRERPGMMPRSPAWWSVRIFADPEPFRNDMSANRYVSYEVDGELRGYLRYRTKSNWDEAGLPNGRLAIEELIVTSDDAYTALIEHALGVDLVGTVEAVHRPPDEPLYWMLEDPRRLKRKPADSLWLRVVDVPRTLEARKYATPGSLTLEVVDDFLGAGGRFHLEAQEEGARCTATERSPDIRLHIRDLGAAYLGGVRFSTLARAGRVEGDEAAVKRANTMFSWHRDPWCPEVF